MNAQPQQQQAQPADQAQPGDLASLVDPGAVRGGASLRGRLTAAASELLPEKAKPRRAQVECLEALVTGKDVFAQMHTGAGKSLVFQAYAHARRHSRGCGSVLVISPIIALSDDHMRNARKLGLRAHAWHSQMHAGQPGNPRAEAARDWREGRCEILLAGPEALAAPNSMLIQALRERPPALVVVDEAHLVSVWGRGFRHEYRNIRHHLHRILDEQASAVPWLALSATVTESIEKDVTRNLELGAQRPLHRHKGTLARRNLRLRIEKVPGEPGKRFTQYGRLLLPLADNAGGPVIFYAQYARDAELLAKEVSTKWKRRCVRYHAKERPEEAAPVGWQRETAHAFRKGEAQVMIATSAYGMGIDLPSEVKSVVCLGPPLSMAELVQQLGRAGRKGSDSLCTLIYNEDLLKKQKTLVESSWPSPDVLAASLAQLAEPTEQDADLFYELAGTPRDEEGRLKTNDVGNVVSAASSKSKGANGKDASSESVAQHLLRYGLIEEVRDREWRPGDRHAKRVFQLVGDAAERWKEVEARYAEECAEAHADAELVRRYIERVEDGACAVSEMLAAFSDPLAGKDCKDLDCVPCSSCDARAQTAWADGEAARRFLDPQGSSPAGREDQEPELTAEAA